MKNAISLIGLLFLLNNTKAQPVYENTLSAKRSDDAVVLYLSQKAIGEHVLVNDISEVIIERALPGEKNFSQISKVKMAAGAEEFKKAAGADAFEYLRKAQNLKSDKDVYDYILNNSSAENLGSLAFDMKFMAAIGGIFVDRQVLAMTKSGIVRYKAKYIKRTDKAEAYSATGEIKMDDLPALSKPYVISKSETDDYIDIEWRSQSDKSADAVFAVVYKSDEFTKGFRKAGKIFAINYDSIGVISYNWNEKVKPHGFYRYFIRPTTITGMEGPASDTAQVVSVSASSVPVISNLEAIDTTQGVLLKWNALPKNILSNGLAIERSRKAEVDFITIDTLSAYDSLYLDRRVVPGFSYYYRTRTLTIRNDQLPPSAFANVNYTGSGLSLFPPLQIIAHAGPDHISLKWSASTQPGVSGYRIYRSSGINDSMTVLVPFLPDTFYVDSILLFPLRNYSYTIVSVAFDDRISFSSDTLRIQLASRSVTAAPDGLMTSAGPDKVKLLWNDMRRTESSVFGYNIYRNSSGEFSPLSGEVPVEQIIHSGFKKINSYLIQASVFTDSDIISGARYAYAVTSISADSVESAVAEIAMADIPLLNIPAPEQFSVQEGSKGPVLSWTAPQISGLHECLIYRRAASESQPQIVSRVRINSGTFTDEGLAKGLYFYSIAYASPKASGPRSLEKGFSRK